MLTLAQVVSVLDPADRMVALDLQDAYFHSPVSSYSPTDITCGFSQEHFQFSEVLFGLTSTPRLFTKVMVVVAAYLPRLGIPVFPYIDDWLLKAGLPQKVVNHLQTTDDLLILLSFPST